MSDVEIKGRISVDTGEAAKKLADLNKVIAEQKKVWKDSAIGSDEYKAAQEKLKTATTEYNGILKENQQQQSKSAGAFGLLKEKVGAISPAMGGAIQGTQGLGTAFKALLANPVGLVLLAIVGTLKLLYEWFANSFAGGQKLEQMFAGLQAAGQALMDNLGRVASAIKKVFTLDFSGARAEIKGVADAATDAYNKMAKLTKEKQQLDRDQADNDLESAKRQQLLADLKEKLADGDVPIAEKKKAQKELLAMSEANAAEDIKLAKAIADNKIAQLTLQKDGEKKNYVEIQKIKADQIRVETENDRELKQIRKAGNTLNKEEDAQRKALHDADMARRKEAAQKNKEYHEEQKRLAAEKLALDKKLADAKKAADEALIKGIEEEGERMRKAEEDNEKKRLKTIEDNERFRLSQKKKFAELDALNNPDSIEYKVAKIKADLDIELFALAEGDVQRQILAKKASDAIIAIQQDETNKKKQMQDAELQAKLQFAAAIGNVFGGLSALFKKGTAAAKIAGLAEIAIGTGVGFINALDIAQKGSKATGPAAPFAFPIFYATQIAAVLGAAARAKSIFSSVEGGSGGGSATAPSIPSAPLGPQSSSTSLDAASIQGIGNAAAGGINRTFVLDSDVNDGQERQARISRAARLG